MAVIVWRDGFGDQVPRPLRPSSSSRPCLRLPAFTIASTSFLPSLSLSPSLPRSTPTVPVPPLHPSLRPSPPFLPRPSALPPPSVSPSCPVPLPPPARSLLPSFPPSLPFLPSFSLLVFPPSPFSLPGSTPTVPPLHFLIPSPSTPTLSFSSLRPLLPSLLVFFSLRTTTFPFLGLGMRDGRSGGGVSVARELWGTKRARVSAWGGRGGADAGCESEIATCGGAE
ncbi:hypothetical protein B0H19DRAFT_1252338 [Mycena capillaripes]|nr:hypothetical protein B0H19DRAFT_1252338 [Mycena capillaripes]